jgi:hypothetical protein
MPPRFKAGQKLDETQVVPEIFQAPLLYLVGFLDIGSGARDSGNEVYRLAVLTAEQLL